MATPTRPVDTKAHEKEYLRRAAAGEWERLKPFSPPGTSTVAESASLMLDFAAALVHLPPAPSDLILDLGAGACWCSDWLQRLNLRTVAVDISWDMLRLGRTRLPDRGKVWLAAGDLEALPFASSSFDKAYCLSAIHHVPDIDRALREIHRVLTPDGAVLFSEPGVGHAEKPGSVAAMRDFGVLEQDIIVSRFMEGCRRAGFADVRIRPLSYVNTGIDLTGEQWDAWCRLARSKRPVRAMRKIWRGILEVFGVGKQDVLFEEAFGMTIVRLLKHAMEDHPVVIASNAPLGASGARRYGSRVQLLDAPDAASPGSPLRLRVRATNTGSVVWHTAERAEGGYVRLGVQLLDADRRLVNKDYHRETLAGPVAPGEQIEWEFECLAPGTPGSYHLKLDLVVEGVTWLEVEGSEVAVRRLDVANR
ncbi:MAG TPA: class I SAM-dependent methyltransferase [Vicinamibacterales bacterium]|nr:class I SAM-dependent methyltransferase [Vicinamibacterales bacterium]